MHTVVAVCVCVCVHAVLYSIPNNDTIFLESLTY